MNHLKDLVEDNQENYVEKLDIEKINIYTVLFDASSVFGLFMTIRFENLTELRLYGYGVQSMEVFQRTYFPKLKGFKVCCVNSEQKSVRKMQCPQI